MNKESRGKKQLIGLCLTTTGLIFNYANSISKTKIFFLPAALCFVAAMVLLITNLIEAAQEEESE